MKLQLAVSILNLKSLTSHFQTQRNMLKLAPIFLLLQLSLAFPRKPILIDPSLVDTEAVSVDVTVEKNAFGTCMCDITRNACDAYCCCDLDCGAAILEVWKSDYDLNCAKNYIGQAFKPA